MANGDPTSSTLTATAPTGDFVPVKGPDGRMYHFPKGTDKAAAIKYFKAKNILGPSAGAKPTGASTSGVGLVASHQPTAAQTPDSQFYKPLSRTPGHYTSEGVRGFGRALQGMVSYPFEAAKLRPGEEEGTTGNEILTPTRKNIGPVGRFLLHTGEDFFGGLSKGYEARQRAKQSGEGVAGQVLATLEQYPIIGAGVQHQEKGGPGELAPPTKEGKQGDWFSLTKGLSPEAVGGATEIASFAAAPKIIDKVTGMVKPALLLKKAADMNARAIKVAKGQIPEPVGLRVAQEHIHGSVEELPNLIERKRAGKEQQVTKLSAEEDKAGPVHDIDKEIKPIVDEWQRVQNERANLNPSVIKKVNGLIAQLRMKFDPTTGKFVPRDLSKLTMTDMVNLTRWDSLLSKLSKFDKNKPLPEPIINVARRLSDAIHTKISEVNPEIGRLRDEQGELITARDQALENLKNFKNDKMVTARSIFRAGKTAIATYVGLKMLGVPFAEAYAIPLLLFNALQNTKFVTTKASMMARLAEMVDSVTGGTYRPPTARRASPGGQTPPNAPTPTSPQGGPLSGAGTTVTGAPSSPAAALAIGGVAPPTGAPALTGDVMPAAARHALGLEGDVASEPQPEPEVASVRAANAPLETAGAKARTEAEQAKIAKRLEARATSKAEVEKFPKTGSTVQVSGKPHTVMQSWSSAEGEGFASVKDNRTGETKTIKLSEIEPRTGSGAEVGQGPNAGGPVSARLRQDLMNEIDTQVSRITNPKTAMDAPRAEKILDQIKTLLDSDKAKGLTSEEIKTLKDRANWRKWQAKHRESKPGESVAAREPKPDEIAVKNTASLETAAAEGLDPERSAMLKEQAYQQLAKFGPAGAEWAENLKKQARELEAAARAKGVSYDPNTELNSVVEAIQLMREQGAEQIAEQPKKAPAKEEPLINKSSVSPPTPVIQKARTESGNIKMGADTERLARILGSSLYKERGPSVVVKELLQNAYDATRSLTKGEGQVDVTFDQSDHSLEVKDNGPGMTPNEVFTVFTDLGSSGKASQAEASGGFGLAKAAPFMIADKLEVTTIARDPKTGIYTRTSFTSTPDDIVTGKVKPQINTVSSDTVNALQPTSWKTGTTVKAFFNEKSDMYSARNFAQNAQRSTRAPAKLTVRNKYSWSNQAEVMKEDFAPIDTHVATVEVPDSARLEIFKSSQREPLAKAMGQIIAEIQNNGIYQFTKNQWLGGATQLRGMPSRIVIDVKSLVPEGHENYPFSANREQLRDLVDTKVSELINEHFVKPAVDQMNAEIGRLYNSLPVIKLGSGRTAPVFDSGGRLTPAEMNEFVNNRAVRVITDAIQQSSLNTMERMKTAPFGKWMGDPKLTLGAGIERTGLVLSQEVHGVNVPNIADKTKSTIFFNPFSFDELTASDDSVASLMFHTVKHEIIHDVVKGHNETFTSAEAKVSHYLGMNFELSEMLRIRDAYKNARSGSLKTEFDRALQIYKESRQRDEVTPDLLGGEKLSSEKSESTTGGGQGVPTSRERTLGGGLKTQGGAGLFKSPPFPVNTREKHHPHIPHGHNPNAQEDDR